MKFKFWYIAVIFPLLAFAFIGGVKFRPQTSVAVITKEFISQADLMQEIQVVQATLSQLQYRNQLKQIQKVQTVYRITWTDDKNAYSGVYLDGQIIALQSAPLTPTSTETPKP